VNALGYTIAGDTPQHTECGVILRAAGARDDMVDPRLRNAKNRQSLALCDKKFRKEFKSRKRLYYKDRAAEFKQRQSLSKESLAKTELGQVVWPVRLCVFQKHCHVNLK
jgi:hypothetical protein